MNKLKRLFTDPGRLVHRLLKIVTFRKRLPLSWRVRLGQLLPPFSGTSRFKAIYVVTYGRSGSTLLTSYLSSFPGIDIKGENYLFMLPAADAEARLTKARRKPYKDRHLKSNAWYGSHQFDSEVWKADQLAAMLNQLYPQQLIPKTIGFKEIRWYGDAASQDLAATLDWLCSLRTPSAVIFHKRDLAAVFSSGWWVEKSAAELAGIRQQITEFEAAAEKYSITNPDNVFITNYEDFTSGPDQANELCKFLGVEFSEANWRALLTAPHSYPSKPN